MNKKILSLTIAAGLAMASATGYASDSNGVRDLYGNVLVSKNIDGVKVIAGKVSDVLIRYNNVSGCIFEVYGGEWGTIVAGSADGFAKNNMVTIYNTVNVKGDVFGGDGTLWGGSYNIVNICDGSVNGNIVGGSYYSLSREGSNDYNTISLGGIVEYDANRKITKVDGNKGKVAIGASIQGTNADGGGNQLNVLSMGNTVEMSVVGIDTINFFIPNIPEAKNTSNAMLSAKYISRGYFGINAGVVKGTALNVGDKIKLIYTRDSTKNFPKSVGNIQVNDFQDYKLTVDSESNDHNFIVRITDKVSPEDPKRAENPKSPVETQLAAVNFTNTAADLAVASGISNAEDAVAVEGDTSFTTFGYMGGNKNKLKTGSHVDVKGWNLGLGLAKEISNNKGKLLIGPLIEYGRGSYDSYLNNGLHGEGDVKYIGGGIIVKQTNNNGVYLEGSLRGGRVSDDYSVHSNHYESKSGYLGAHIGLGKIVKLNAENSLNYYGKYFYAHQFADDTFIKGADAKLHLDGVDSNRIKIGARFTRACDEKNSIYAGLAWQNELSGTARGIIDGIATPAPSLKGHSGLMELGWKVDAGKKMELDLGANGYIGKQKGAALKLSVNYKF